jgi:hypothetical protein
VILDHVGKLEPSGMRQTERLLHEAQGDEPSGRHSLETEGREWIAAGGTIFTVRSRLSLSLLLLNSWVRLGGRCRERA